MVIERQKKIGWQPLGHRRMREIKPFCSTPPVGSSNKGSQSYSNITSASLPKSAGVKMVLELRKKNKLSGGLVPHLRGPDNTKKIKIKSRFFRVF